MHDGIVATNVLLADDVIAFQGPDTRSTEDPERGHGLATLKAARRAWDGITPHINNLICCSKYRIYCTVGNPLLATVEILRAYAQSDDHDKQTYILETVFSSIIPQFMGELLSREVRKRMFVCCHLSNIHNNAIK